jgi:hypothetical protein
MGKKREENPIYNDFIKKKLKKYIEKINFFF